MKSPLLIAATAALSLSACVYVEPKGSVAIDEECDSAYKRYYVGLDKTPGEGLVVIDRGNGPEIGPNLPATIGSCANDACIAILGSMIRQFAAEAFVAGSVAVANNTVSWLQKEADCKKPGEEDDDAQEMIIVEEEELGYLLKPVEPRAAN